MQEKNKDSVKSEAKTLTILSNNEDRKRNESDVLEE